MAIAITDEKIDQYLEKLNKAVQDTIRDDYALVCTDIVGKLGSIDNKMAFELKIDFGIGEVTLVVPYEKVDFNIDSAIRWENYITEVVSIAFARLINGIQTLNGMVQAGTATPAPAPAPAPATPTTTETPAAEPATAGCA